MAFVSELFDQLRDLLNDATDTQVPFSTKKLFLNNGIRRMFPHVYRVVTDSSVAILADTYDYAVPATLGDGYVISVELETANASGDFQRLNGYDVIVGDEDLQSILRIERLLPEVGSLIRVRAVRPIPVIAAGSYAASQSETWAGPDEAIHLPVLYAMGMCAIRKLDDRQDTLRYSTTQGLNGVTDQDIMTASQVWFSQFESELAERGRPLPIARD